MDDARGMGGGQSGGHLSPIFPHLGNRHAVRRNQASERLAGHILHHQEIHSAVACDIVKRHDVRMVQGRSSPRLLQESPFAIRVGELVVRQNLDCHSASQPRVAGAVHLAHSASAERRLDLIRTQLLDPDGRPSAALWECPPELIYRVQEVHIC